jgi:transposase
VSAPDPQVRIATLERELHWAQLKIQVLEERLRKQRILMLGPQSETLSNLQLELLADKEPGVTAEEVAAEARREPVAKMPQRERTPHPGRERLPESLPRVEKVIPCQDRTCSACGKETAVIGYDALDFVAQGKVKTIVETYPLAEAPKAYERVAEGKARFRAVLTM